MASDESLAVTAGVTSGAAGTWTQLMDTAFNRQGASVQNKSATSLFIVEADTVPASGPNDTELEIPASPAYFSWDYTPRRRLWVRSVGVSQKYVLRTW